MWRLGDPYHRRHFSQAFLGQIPGRVDFVYGELRCGKWKTTGEIAANYYIPYFGDFVNDSAVD